MMPLTRTIKQISVALAETGFTPLDDLGGRTAGCATGFGTGHGFGSTMGARPRFGQLVWHTLAGWRYDC